MKKKFSFIYILLFVGMVAPFFAFATWSGEPYEQGETLTPECTPEEDNCTVSITETGILFSVEGITYIGTLFDTIDPPDSVSIQTSSDDAGYDQPYPGYPHTHSYRVYSYRNEGEGRVYSQTYTGEYLTITSDDVNESYDVTVTWDPVAGADGYRVFGSNPVPYDEYHLGTSFQYYQDVEGTELIDTSNIEDWSEGSEVFPSGIPFAVSESLGTVGIGMLPSENYALSVSGDTLTNGSIIFGNPNNDTAGIHYGPTGLYGQAQNWTPNPDGMNGVWIEGSNSDEGGGFYTDGDMAAIWSAGDVDLLRIYDEDTLSTNRAAMVFDGDGFLRSDTGLVGVNDSMTVDGVLSVGILQNNNESEDYLGIQNQAMVNIVQPLNTPTEQLVGGDFENYNWYWQHSSSWSIDSGAYFTFNSEDTSRTISQYYDEQEIHPIEGDLYDVSIDVGGDTGSISVCLGQQGSGTGCETVNAGAGTTQLTLAWHPDGPEVDDENTIINIKATEDFNGYVDNISVMSQSKYGLAFLSSDYPVTASIGVDAGEITDATGFKITTSDPGSTKSASFFLNGEDDSHYGYILPALGEVAGGIDTVCMQDLGNCGIGSGLNSYDTEERDLIESPDDNQIIFNTDTHSLQYYDADAELWREVLATESEGLEVVGPGFESEITQVADYNTETWSMDTVVAGDVMYSANGTHLDLFDATDPANEQLLTYYDFGDAQVSRVIVVGDVAYVRVNDTINLLDISDTSVTPILLGTFESGSSINDYAVHHDTLYVIDSGGSFAAYDVSGIGHDAPGDPQPFSEVPNVTSTTVYPISLALSGDYAYIAGNGDRIEIFDVADPTDEFPQVAVYDYNGDDFAGDIAIDGDYLYATRYTNDGESFVVLDISDPENITKVAGLDIGDWRIGTRIAIVDNMVYVADGEEDSVYVINSSYPIRPFISGYTTTPGNSYGVSAYDSYIFVADGSSGILVYQMSGNYAALFNDGFVGIGTNAPAFSLDVGAAYATARLTIATTVPDGDGFLLTESDGNGISFEFDSDNTISSMQRVYMLDELDAPLSPSALIDATVDAINQSEATFSAVRSGNTIIITQASTGIAGNQWNTVFNDEADPAVHPTHVSPYITLTDFTGGADGNINFGGNLYQNGTVFVSSQWTNFDGGISFDDGDLSIGNDSFLYDSETGITSIDNLSLGALQFDEDAGVVSWVDLPISGDAANGTVQSYTAMIGGLDILTIYGTMDEGELIDTGIRMENMPGLGMGTAGYLCIDGEGDLLTADAGCDVSSIRFKENVNALTDDSGLAEIMKLNPVSFFYKPEFNGALQTNPNFANEQVGFIAEEVGQVDPRLVVYEKDGTTILGVKYEKITAILAKAVKEIGKWTDQFTTKKLCVGSTCVTEAEFLQMIQSAGATPVSSEISPASDPTLDPSSDTPPSDSSAQPEDSSSGQISDEVLDLVAPDSVPDMSLDLLADQSVDVSLDESADSDQETPPESSSDPVPDNGV